MNYRTAICDDSEADRKYLGQLAGQWAQSRGQELEIVEFSSAEKFLFHYGTDKDFDLLLLDIEMDGMDGVTMARRIRRIDGQVPLIFVTGYSDYIADGYEVAALQYLLKPVSREKLFLALDRAAEKRRQNERCLNLEMSGEMVRLPLSQIRYLDVLQNYTTVHAEEDYTVKRTLGDLEQQLDERFFRVGRSLVVNLRQIRRVTRQDIHLADGTLLPLPRGAYAKLNQAIIAHT